jgi:hypothetical protein
MLGFKDLAFGLNLSVSPEPSFRKAYITIPYTGIIYAIMLEASAFKLNFYA